MDVQRDEQRFEKRVDYVAKDEDAQTATGVVMVPKTVDHHGDWETPETIEAFADQFGAFMQVDEADGGVMHAVWPSDWMALERNEVLESAEEIGGETVEEGAWVQTWAYNDDELWGLVEDDILSGHSIGAVDVKWDFVGEDPEDLPEDVDVPEEVDVDEFWELVDGIVQEVSAVDFPAVPDAQILTTAKARAATAQKRLADHLGNREGFLEEAQERGHSESEAQRMWDVLDRAVSVEGAGEPGAKRKLTSAAAAFLNTLTRSDDDGGSEALGGGRATSSKNAAGGETPDDDGSTDAADDMGDSNTDNEPPEWAQEWQEQVNERLDEQNERIEAALDGEGGDDAFDDAPEWAQQFKEDVDERLDKQSERVDAISEQTGATSSQQLGGAEKGGGDEGGLSERQEWFVPPSKKREARARAGGGR